MGGDKGGKWLCRIFSANFHHPAPLTLPQGQMYKQAHRPGQAEIPGCFQDGQSSGSGTGSMAGIGSGTGSVAGIHWVYWSVVGVGLMNGWTVRDGWGGLQEQ